MFKIRDYVESDQDAARRLIESGLGERFGNVDASKNPDLEDILFSYIFSGGQFFVAEIEGRLVGTAGLLFAEEHAQLVRVSTHCEHRRCGIASALIQRCIEATKQAGLRRLVTHTQPEWTDSVSFYSHSGFEPFGEDDVDIHLVRLVQVEA
ncbi:MAG: GNAT family N-acetyltransferase [Planctomycetota bacterium]|nr:GNAT family N-acetyltransferase [Planctomycetota bacterium]